MSILEAIVLGLVQGLTEFIPISSTAHLEIVPVLLGWGDPGAAASAVIQFGTWIAALIYFAKDIVRLIGGFFRGLSTRRLLADTDSREAWLIIIGTIPIVILGLALKKHIESTFRGLWVVTTMVIVVAILLWLLIGEGIISAVGDASRFAPGHALAAVVAAHGAGSRDMLAVWPAQTVSNSASSQATRPVTSPAAPTTTTTVTPQSIQAGVAALLSHEGATPQEVASAPASTHAAGGLRHGHSGEHSSHLVR